MLAALLVALSMNLNFQTAPAAGASDATEAATEAAADAEREAELNRRVCRREHVVGSNRPQRVCRTVREWNQLRELAREEVDRSGQGVR